MTASDRRALATGAGVCIALALLFRGVPALLSWEAELRRRVEALSRTAEREEEAFASLRGLEDSAVELRRKLVASAPDLVPGASEDEANAALAALLRQVLRSMAARHVSLSPLLDSVSAGLLRRASARIELEGDADQLGRVLVLLGAHRPVLVVREVTVTADASAPGDGPEHLRISLVVHGWWMGRVPDGDPREHG